MGYFLADNHLNDLQAALPSAGRPQLHLESRPFQFIVSDVDKVRTKNDSNHSSWDGVNTSEVAFTVEGRGTISAQLTESLKTTVKPNAVSQI